MRISDSYWGSSDLRITGPNSGRFIIAKCGYFKSSDRNKEEFLSIWLPNMTLLALSNDNFIFKLINRGK